jgi:hypothetical protein
MGKSQIVERELLREGWRNARMWAPEGLPLDGSGIAPRPRRTALPALLTGGSTPQHERKPAPERTSFPASAALSPLRV